MNAGRSLARSGIGAPLRALLAASVAALWLALLAGMLGRYAWPLDLFAHFRLQYAVAFVLIAIVLLAQRRRVLAVSSLAGALLSALPLFAYLGPPALRAEASTRTFRLVSANIWFRSRDLTRLERFLAQADADAVVLQEISRAQADALRERLPQYQYAYTDLGRPSAVVLSRWPILAARPVELTARGASAAWVDLDWQGTKVSLLGVHLHWPLGPGNSRLRDRELGGIAAFAAQHAGPLVVAGDFNVTPWSAHFRGMLDESGLQDAARGHGLVRSWPAQFPPLGIRIDHCLVSRHWRSVDVRTGPYVSSDHLPVIVELAPLEQGAVPREEG